MEQVGKIGQTHRPWVDRCNASPGSGQQDRQQESIALPRPMPPKDIDQRQASIAGKGRDVADLARHDCHWIIVALRLPPTHYPMR